MELCFAIATCPIEEAPGVRTAAFSAASAVVQETAQEAATNWKGSQQSPTVGDLLDTSVPGTSTENKLVTLVVGNHAVTQGAVVRSESDDHQGMTHSNIVKDSHAK